MPDVNQNAVLWALVVVLCVGVGYGLYQNTQLRQALEQEVVMGAPSARTQVVANMPIVGQDALFARGTVDRIEGRTLWYVPAYDGAVVRADASDAEVLVALALKTEAEQRADQEAQEAQLKVWYQNPEANRERITRLHAPLAFVVEPIELSELKSGDSVFIFADTEDSRGLHAVRVVVIPPGLY